MRRIRPLVVLAAALAAPLRAADGTPAARAESLSWLAGAWSGTDGPLEMEEVWTAPKGGSLLAVHRDVKGGRTVSFEFLRIAETEGGLVYHASPGGKAPTPFALAESGPRRAVFENRAHDFPQRILYWLDDAGALHARIEGPRNGKTASLEWTWTRAR